MSKMASARREPGRSASAGRASLVAAVVVEAGLFGFYWREDALFHWFVHFFVGASAALVVMAVLVAIRRRPVPWPWAWMVLAHLYAMFPDLLIIPHIPHEHWMNVFLGHVAVHYVPGEDWTWYGVFLVALAAYLIALDRRAPARGRAPRLTGG